MLGVILAGGHSTRMGHDKALLRIDGRRVLERNRLLLQRVCGETLIVARDPAHAATLELPGARIVCDVVPDCGPLGGLHTAFEHSTDNLFVLACDLPFVEEPLLTRLAAQFGTERPLVLLPRTPEGADVWRDQPLCAIWSHDCKTAVADALAARRLSLLRMIKEWQHVLRVNITAVDAPQLRNINTPQDLTDAK